MELAQILEGVEVLVTSEDVLTVGTVGTNGDRSMGVALVRQPGDGIGVRMVGITDELWVGRIGQIKRGEAGVPVGQHAHSENLGQCSLRLRRPELPIYFPK